MQNRKLLQLVFVVLTLLPFLASAADKSVGTDTPIEFNDNFYQIESTDSNKGPASDMNPQTLLLNMAHEISEYASTAKLSLLQWVKMTGDSPTRVEKYDRKKHFGTWMKDPEGSCQNTRALVLVRDATTDVKYKDGDQCVVVSSTWDEPYTGKTVKKASDLQIDHVVPLKHAYLAGAWKWDPAVRCNYANFMANNFHLLAVSGSENEAKGDKAPQDYMPPNADFSCDYLRIWLNIKAIWNLNISAEEARFIKSKMQENQCDKNDFLVSVADMKKQQAKSQDPIEPCADFGSSSGN